MTKVCLLIDSSLRYAGICSARRGNCGNPNPDQVAASLSFVFLALDDVSFAVEVEHDRLHVEV